MASAEPGPTGPHKPADEITDDIGMTHDDLVAVLLLLGVGPVNVAAEGCFNARPVFVVLLEDGTKVEGHLCQMSGFCLNPSVKRRTTQGIHREFGSKMRPMRISIWKILLLRY